MIDKWARSLMGISLAAVLVNTAAFAAPATDKTDPTTLHEPAKTEADPLTPKDTNTNQPLLAPGSTSNDAQNSNAPSSTTQPNTNSTQPSSTPSTTPSDTTAAQPVIDPVLVQVRAKLQQNVEASRGDDRGDATAIKAYYAANSGKLLWTSKDGLSERGQKVIDEIRKADDWGLEASAFDLPQTPVASNESGLADAELKVSMAVLKYARYARGGRIDPTSFSQISEKSEKIYFDDKPRLYEPKSVLDAISAAAQPDVYLQNLHPKQEGFQKLREALIALKGAQDAASSEVKIPKGPTLKLGDRNEQVALVRKRLDVAATDADKENVVDPALVDAIKAYQKKQGLKETGQIDAKLRSTLNGPEIENVEQQRMRIIANMERWRWQPDDFGTFYVWNNIPEQLTRVMDNGKNVLTERIVIGKPASPTPVFSAHMQFVIFHPEWGVPDSIKSNELGPKLRNASGGGFTRRDSEADDFWFFGGGRGGFESNGGSSRVLQSYNLRVSYNGREVDPDSVDWSNVDIKKYTFIQPSGGKNVLGVVKFRFPNKHDVYMHDTPDKQLFANFPRAYSHGCMRTQNPVHLAEVLLEHDKGWSAAKVRSIANEESSAPDEITLTNKVPIHITYFTADVGADGKVNYHPDVYGIDGKMVSVLAKRTVRFSSQMSDAEEKEPQKTTRREADETARRKRDYDHRRFWGDEN